MLTERLALILSYTYSDVDYLEAENTGYTPYMAETGSVSLIYDLTEKDKLTFSLFAVDYASRNDQVTYQLFMSRFGIDHKFSETLSADFLVGVSRRNSTNLTTQTFDFFGNIIVQTQEVDSRDRGLVFDAGIKKLFERGKLEADLVGIIQLTLLVVWIRWISLKLSYDEKLSPLWRYDLSARYDDITSISSGTRTTDRDTLFFESKVFYSISLKWTANASYRYVQRKFKSDTSDNRAPHSNRIYVGLSYNFPSLSTF